MASRHILRSLPGLFATLLVVVAATNAAMSEAAGLFYEGWGQPLPRLLGYIAPPVVLIVLGLVAFRWPGPGGTLLLVASGTMAASWVRARLADGLAPVDAIVVTAAIVFGPVILAALLFLFEARHQRLLRAAGEARPRPRVLGLWREAMLVAVPTAAVVSLSVQQLPALLARHDDGMRGARVIAGNGVTFVWAPRGPGWNGRTTGGESLAWDALAKHGAAALERCAYLSEDGTALLDTPLGIWRMPTSDEIVRSLTRNGQSAECAWDGRVSHAGCRTPPDKETPLWAPDEPPIYYWSSQAIGSTRALAVNYTGGISDLPRSWSRPSVGFRCVKSLPDTAR